MNNSTNDSTKIQNTCNINRTNFTDNNDNTLYIDNFIIDLNNCLGKGSYGNIFKCKCISNNKNYAVKIENKNSIFSQIEYEYKVIKHLNSSDNETNGIVDAVKYITKGDYNFLILNELGKNIEYLAFNCTPNKKLSLKSLLLLSNQIVSI